MTYLGGSDSQESLRAVSCAALSDKVTKSRLSTKSELDLVTLHRDLATAREVQRASFPQQPPAIPGLKCASFYRPARSIGGDYYDFLALPKGAWGIAVDDVSGKGIAAALVMANLQGSLRVQVLQSRSDIQTLITDVNRLVWEFSPQHFFAPLVYAEYRPAFQFEIDDIFVAYTDGVTEPENFAGIAFGHRRLERILW